MLSFGLLLICAHFEPAPAPEVAASDGPSSGYGDGSTETDVAVTVDHGRGHGDGSRHGGDGENPFVETAGNPVSTFPLTADTASYRDVRRTLLEEKRLPAPDSVRVAGLVERLLLFLSATGKWRPRLAHPRPRRMSLEPVPPSGPHRPARRPAAVVVGAAVRVAFNPRRVAAYRLIGYEGRGTREGGDSLGPGRSATALYEVVPAKLLDDSEWLTVQMRYRDEPSGAGRRCPESR